MTFFSHFFLSFFLFFLLLTNKKRLLKQQTPLLDRAAASASSRMVITGEILFFKHRHTRTHTYVYIYMHFKLKNPLSYAMLVISTAVSQKELSQGCDFHGNCHGYRGERRGTGETAFLSIVLSWRLPRVTPHRLQKDELLLSLKRFLHHRAGPPEEDLGRLWFPVPVLYL